MTETFVVWYIYLFKHLNQDENASSHKITRNINTRPFSNLTPCNTMYSISGNEVTSQMKDLQILKNQHYSLDFFPPEY